MLWIGSTVPFDSIPEMPGRGALSMWKIPDAIMADTMRISLRITRMATTIFLLMSNSASDISLTRGGKKHGYLVTVS